MTTAFAGVATNAAAATPKPDNPQGATIAITTPSVAPGGIVSFTGTGWSTLADSSAGAVVGGVKLDDTDQLNASPIAAAKDGTLTGSVTLPSDVTAGEHWLRFLSGSDQIGDPTRSLHASFTVAAPSAPASVTLASASVAAGGTLSASGAHFPADATVTVKIDKTTTLATTTASADGSFSSATIAIPADTAAGAHTLYFLAAGGVSVQVPVTVTAAGAGAPTGPTDPTAPADPNGPSSQLYQIAATLTGPGGSYEIAVDQPLGKAFVASPKDGASGSIAVIDLKTRAITDSWSLPAAPYGIAANTQTHRLYTADTRTNQVSMIDARTGDVIKVIGGIDAPHGLEVDSAHNLVYVTDVGGNQVDVINGATNTVTTKVTAGKTPVQVVIDNPHGSYWVAYTGDNTVREFDRVTNKLEATVETAGGPQNMALNPATGELLVDNFGAASVQVIDTATATITATIPVADSPIGISVDPVTNSYFVTHLAADPDTGKSKVSVIDGTTKAVSQVLTVPDVALGVATDSGRHTTYVTNRDGAEISVITPVGDQIGNGSGDGPHQAGVIISATIPDTGGLAMSVANKAVALPAAAPNSGLTSLVSAGTLPTVTIADLRATNPGWTATGTVTDFSSGTDSFAGSRLGWTPKVLTNGAKQVVTAGAKVNPAATGGLADGAVLASAASGKGVGTATVNAALALNAPTDTAPGTYAATLTMTVI